MIERVRDNTAACGNFEILWRETSDLYYSIYIFGVLINPFDLIWVAPPPVEPPCR